MIPRIRFTDEGIVAPSREEITAALWQMMRDSFGANLTEDARTPQGQIVTSLTAAIVDDNDAKIELANNFDPFYAFGPFQDALARIYFIERKEAVPSVAMLEFMGIAGTPIPKGFILLDSSGREWITVEHGEVGGPLIAAVCSVTGPIQASPDTITVFKETIEGVDRVANPSAAAVGTDTESRANFELRRRDSVAANSKNMNNSVYGAVANLPGVIDAFVIDNPADTERLVGSTEYPMIRNSLLVSVVGGDPYEIAGMIMAKGGTGCAFVGNTTVIWRDEESKNAFKPEYEVKFLRTDHITVHFRLTVVDAEAISYANTEAAKRHIITGFQSGERRGRIGGLVIGSAYLCGLDNAAIRPVRLEVSTDGTTWLDHIQFGVDQFPVSSTENVTLVSM